MHYFLIYIEISELLFQKSNASYFFSIYWLTVLCVNMILL